MTRLGFIILALMSSPALAEDVEIDPVAQREIVLDRLRTSTTIVVGAVFAGQSLVETPPQFRAILPQDTAGLPVCLRTRSVDGFYQSEYDYVVPEDWSSRGTVTFSYPTDYAEIVSDLPGEGFAVTAAQGACEASGDDIYVGFWNTPANEDANDMLLALNTSGASRVIVFVGDDLSAPAQRCEQIQFGQVTGFDYICRLVLPADPVPRTRLEIQRTYGETEDPPDEIWIRINQ